MFLSETHIEYIPTCTVLIIRTVKMGKKSERIMLRITQEIDSFIFMFVWVIKYVLCEALRSLFYSLILNVTNTVHLLSLLKCSRILSVLMYTFTETRKWGLLLETGLQVTKTLSLDRQEENLFGRGIETVSKS